MNYKTYKIIRSYCWQELSTYIGGPASNLASAICGPLGVIKHEQEAAMGLFHCTDLTPRERAATHLLAVISNHRAIAWQREPVTPDGREPALPLEPRQAAELWAQTRKAFAEYSVFIPEREAAMLLAMCDKFAAQEQEHLKRAGYRKS